MRYLIAILLFPATCLACAQQPDASNINTSDKPIPEKASPVAVAGEFDQGHNLVNEHAKNPLAFEKKFAGKLVRIKSIAAGTTGKIPDTGEPYIVGLTGSIEHPQIALVFRKADIGQPESVRLKFAGYSIVGKILITKDGSVAMEECQIENLQYVHDVLDGKFNDKRPPEIITGERSYRDIVITAALAERPFDTMYLNRKFVFKSCRPYLEKERFTLRGFYFSLSDEQKDERSLLESLRSDKAKYLDLAGTLKKDADGRYIISIESVKASK